MEKAITEKQIKQKLQYLLEADPKQKWLQQGFTIVTNKTIIDPRLTSSDFRVYVVLLMHLINKEKCFPSVGTIGKEAGLKERQIRKILKKLEDLGYLAVEKRNGKTNIFKPLMR